MAEDSALEESERAIVLSFCIFLVRRLKDKICFAALPPVRDVIDLIAKIHSSAQRFPLKQPAILLEG
jgi:hypothetical protein